MENDISRKIGQVVVLKLRLNSEARISTSICPAEDPIAAIGVNESMSKKKKFVDIVFPGNLR